MREADSDARKRLRQSHCLAMTSFGVLSSKATTASAVEILRADVTAVANLAGSPADDEDKNKKEQGACIFAPD